VGGHAVDNYGLIQAKKGTISTDSAGGTNQYGTGKLDAKNINMQANGQITVDANAEIKASEDITILSRERFLRNSGTIFGKNVSASVAQDVINNGDGLIDASNSLSLTSVSGNVSNSGTIGRNNLTTANISANGNIAGSGQFLAKTLNLTSTTGDIGSLAAPLAIDANTVTLNAQDAINGNAYIADIDDIDLGASNVRGELQLASTGAGSLDVTGVVSGGNILLANVDGDVNVNDALTATSKVDLQSERHTNINANVRAEDGALTINADTDSDGSGNVTIGVGTNNFTQRTATITGENVTNNGDLKAYNLDIDADNKVTTGVGSKFDIGRKVTIDADSVDNNGTIIAKRNNIEITTANELRNDGTLRTTSDDNIILESTAGNVVNTGAVESANNATITAANNVTNSGSVTADNDATVTAGNRFHNQTGGSVVANNALLAEVTDGSLENDGLLKADNGRATVRANSIVNDTTGTIEATNEQLHLETGSPWNSPENGKDVTNRGQLTANTRLKIHAKDDVVNTGDMDAQTIDIFAADAIQITGGSLDATANVNLITGNATTQVEGRDVTISNATVTAGNQVKAQAGDDITITNSTLSGRKIDLAAADNVTTNETVADAQSISGSEFVAINAGNDITLKGDIASSGGSVDVVANSAAEQNKLNNQADITAATTVKLQAGDGTNTFVDGNDLTTSGTVIAGSTAELLANDDVNVSGGSITAEGNVTLAAADMVTNNGAVKSNAGIADVDAGGAFNSNEASTLTGSQGVDIDADSVNAKGAITAENNNVTIDTANNLIVSGDVTSANNDVLLVSRIGDVRSSKQITADRLARMIAGKDAINSGNIDARNVTLIAGEKVNNSGTVTADNAVSLRSKGTLTAANAAAVRAGDELASVAFQEGEDVTNSGTISAGGFVELFANDDVSNTATGSISGTQVAVTTGDDVTNNGSITSTTGDIQIDATGSKVTNAGTMDSANDLNINAGDSATFQDGDDIVNTETGKLLAANDVTLNAGDDITNNGEIKGRNVDIDAADAVSTGDDSKTIARRTLDIDAQSVTNNGRMVARQDDITVTALTGNLNNSGTLKSRDGSVFATADQGNVNNQGTVEANNRARLLARQGNVTNGGDITGRNVVLRAKNDVTNQADGTIVAINDVDLKAGFGNQFVEGRDINNAGSIQAGNNVLLRADDDIANNGTSTVTALAGTVDIDAAGNYSSSADSTVVANQGVDIDVAAATNNGLAQAQNGDVTIDTDDNLTNGGTVQADNGAVLLTSEEGNVNSQGTVTAKNRARLLARQGNVTNGGNISGRNVVLRAKNDVTNQTGATITAVNDVDLKAGFGNKFVNGRDIVNNGSIDAGGDVLLRADDDITTGEFSSIDADNVDLIAKDNITVNGSVRGVEGGDVNLSVIAPVDGGTVTLDAGNNITVGNTGRVTAGRLVDADAGNNITVNGTVETTANQGDILVASIETREPSLLRDEINLDAGNNIAINGQVRNNGSLRFDKPIFGDMATTLNVGRPPVMGGGTNNGQIILNAGNNITVGETGVVSAGQIVEGHATNNITVNGVVVTQPSTGNSFPLPPKMGDLELTTQASAGDDISNLDNLLNRLDRIQLTTDEGNININGRVATEQNRLVMGRMGYYPQAPELGVILLSSGNDINVGQQGFVHGTNGVLGLASNDINIAGRVESSSVGFPFTLNQANQVQQLDSTPIDSPVSDGFGLESLSDGVVLLGAGNDINVEETGTITAGNLVAGLAGNDINVEGQIFATGRSRGYIPFGVQAARIGDEILDGPLLDGDIALIAGNDINVTETGSAYANGNVLGLAGRTINNDGSIIAGNGDVVLDAFRRIVNKGAIIAQGGSVGLFTEKGNVANRRNGLIAAADDILVEAGNDIVNNGTISGIPELTADGPQMTADVKLVAENDIRGNGVTRGDKVVLKAKKGDIGSDDTPFNTEANKLRITAKNGSASVSELDGVKLRKSTAQGRLTLVSQNDGDIDVVGEVVANDLDITNNAGDIIANNTMLGQNTVNLTALDGNLSGPSLVSGETMNLFASNDINLNTNASFLSGQAGNDLIITDSNSVIIDSLVAGNALIFSNNNELPGIFDPLAGNGSVLAGVLQGNQVLLNIEGNLLDNNGDALNLIANTNSQIFTGGVIGTLGNPFDVLVRNGTLGIAPNGQLNGFSAVINGTVNPSNTLNLLNNPPGGVLFNGAFLALGPIGDAIFRQGQPALVSDFNRLRDLFADSVNSVDGVITDDATTATEARIIDERTNFGQPFDLRLIEDDTEDGGFSFVAIEEDVTPVE
jgi:hypothetical protein